MTAQTAGSLQEIGEATDSLLHGMNLRSFLLRLPLPAKDSVSTVQGICEKVMKNRSASHTKWNPVDANTEQPDIERAEEQIKRIQELLNSQNAVGFVLVIVENPPQEQSKGIDVHYCPVAGGILEVLDSYERSVRALWYRHPLTHMHACICLHISMHTYAYKYACMHKYAMLINMHSCIHTLTIMHACIHMLTSMHVCMHACMLA